MDFSAVVGRLSLGRTQRVKLFAEEKQHNQSADSEQGVHTSPEERDFADGTKHDGKRKHGNAGEDPVIDDPGDLACVPYSHDEGDGNDVVTEGKPIVSICKKRILIVGLLDGLLDQGQP